MELNEDQKNDLTEMQSLQQQLQIVMSQKQQLLLQQNESDKALEELAKASGAIYRFAGGIMVQKDKATLEKDLKEEKESTEVRLGAIAKQEKKLKDRFDELRKKLEGSFSRKGASN